MKKQLTTAIAALLCITATAQDIKLPAANQKQSSQNVVQTLATRHSVREYGSKQLSNQELSNLC